MRILVVEDDPLTAAYAASGLTHAGHRCDVIGDGGAALREICARPYDIVIVDRMLPELDGLSLVKSMRSAGIDSPVIFLTSIGGVDDRVEGLEAGGDDYLVKPFAFSELLARVGALTRRPPMPKNTCLRVADLHMDLVTRSVTRAGRRIDLQPREFALLEELVRNENSVLTRMMLLERVWNFHFDPKTSVVETHMSRLRAKIDKPFEIALIHTMRNVGYSLHA